MSDFDIEAAREELSKWQTTGPSLRIAYTALDALEDALGELAAFHAECDAVFIPHDAPGLVRHHRGNAGLAAAFDADADWRPKLEDAYRQRDEAVGMLNWFNTSTPGTPDYQILCRRVSAFLASLNVETPSE